MRKGVFLVLLLLLATVAVIACGKKADPRPPIQQTVTSVSDSQSQTVVGERKGASPSPCYKEVSFISSVTDNKTRLCWSYVDSAVEITKVEILRSALNPESGEKVPMFIVVKTFSRDELMAMSATGEGLCYEDNDTKGGVLYTYKISVCDAEGNCYTPTAMTQIRR